MARPGTLHGVSDDNALYARVSASGDAGFIPGKDVDISVDIAASGRER